MTRITHYIDRQFGRPVHVGTEDNIIKFVAKAEQSEVFNQKFSAALTGLTIEEGKKWLRKQFKGCYMAIKEFNTPL